MAEHSDANAPRSMGRPHQVCPECGELLDDGVCECGYEEDDDFNFDRDELGDNPEED